MSLDPVADSLRTAVDERLAARIEAARWRRAHRERARSEKAARRTAGLRARHARKLTRTEDAITTAHQDQERRAAELFGMRPSTAPACPRAAAGKHCRAAHETCVCQRHHHALDHGRMWLDRDGCRVLTGEPYDLDGVELAALVADMAALGLTVRLDGRSLWNPGYALLIRITKENRP